MPENKIIGYDIDGYSDITDALMELLNEYPAMLDGEEIQFSTLGETGIAMFPTSGAIIENENRDILGNVTQICLYPFTIVYRDLGLDENRKAAVKKFLDDLGRWIERQAIAVNDSEYKLSAYPIINGNRRFLTITRQTPAYLGTVTDDKTEDWQIEISARYENQFHI